MAYRDTRGRFVGSDEFLNPTRIWADLPGYDEFFCGHMATVAVDYAKTFAPKSTGESAAAFTPIFGDGWFGIKWKHRYAWYQNRGTKPFVMKSLQGKVIPMWIDDADGSVKRENPKAKQRTTADGRRQTQIFRYASRVGERKTVTKRRGGQDRQVSVPRSYPGAPGRINMRQGARGVPVNTQSGQIAKTNVGVRWRHPGLEAKMFFLDGLMNAAKVNEVAIQGVWVGNDTRTLAKVT